MREILGKSAEKPRFKRIIVHCTQFVPEKRYSDIGAVKKAVLRASQTNFLPFAAAGVLLAASGIFLLINSNPATITADAATGNISAISEPTDTLDIPTKEANLIEEAEPTEEQLPTAEPETILTEQAEPELIEIHETITKPAEELEPAPEIQKNSERSAGKHSRTA